MAVWDISVSVEVNDVADDPQHFFVDEAGDLTLFARRGKSLLGTEGVSSCFMVGVAAIPDVETVAADLEMLRQALLGDSYLNGIPSMSPEEGKTATFFHAKDDCPEVRERVFKLLRERSIKVQVGIRRKRELVELSRLAHSSGFRINVNQIYDDLAKTLFKRSLHRAGSNVIYFARRGKSDRQKALEEAIGRARRNFERDTGIRSDSPTRVVPAYPTEVAGLQVIDYFLWALQRFCERGDDRYFNYLRPNYRLIMDFDDRRSGKTYGRWYSDADPLTKQKWLPLMG